MKERLWYPPNTFQTAAHWQVQLQGINGQWITYTEHETPNNAHAHLERFQQRWPNQRARVTGVNRKWPENCTPVPETIPVGFA